TDRFNSNLANLQTGSPKIALLDVASGTIKSLGGFDDGKNINPQWNTDGRSVLFVSDRRGISNIYRIDRIDEGGGEPTQLTNLLTGVSGITAMSPALSVSNTRI